MKNNSLRNRNNATYCRFLLVIGLIGQLSISIACNLSAQPSKIVENLSKALERGEIDEAVTFFSSRLVNNIGIAPLKASLRDSAAELKEHGGIKSIKFLSDDEAGNNAQLLVEITRGNGNVTKVRYTLVKEGGAWKIDGVSLDISETEPLQPSRAIEDVVNWAHQSGANSIKDWSQKQSAPAICKAAAVDRNTLPDEVRYHDVDDPKTNERLVNALMPLITLVGCQTAQGIVLYKGPNIYAGNLDGGQIAITPGISYFSGSPPDESIFHELAKLRIFFAREVFRQMIPVETPSQGFNEADMRLRRELKLDYLAALASLAIDKDPKILDAVALDIDLYGKPVGIISGTQGTPSLQQIQDIFGAAKQDYRR
jgi:Domain of unknown function (DUF4878)